MIGKPMKFDWMTGLVIGTALFAAPALVLARDSEMWSTVVGFAYSALLLTPVIILLVKRKTKERQMLWMGAVLTYWGLGLIPDLIANSHKPSTIVFGITFAIILAMFFIVLGKELTG